MSSFVYKVLVMGSREFLDNADASFKAEQVDFLRKQMLASFFSALKQDESAVVQFVFPSELGRDRVERPVRGVSRTAFNILESGRKAGRSHARLLPSELNQIDWDHVEFTYTKASIMSLEEERKVPPQIVWNREVLKEVDISEVLVVEHNGAEFWCRDMMRRAQADGLLVRQFSTRSWLPGAAKEVVAR